MSFEELLVSAAPLQSYSLAGSLSEFHGELMRPDRAASMGITALFELYPAGYYRRPATIDMVIEHDGAGANSLLSHYNSEMHCHAAASMVVRIADATIDDSVVYCRNSGNVAILYETFRAPDRAAVNISEAALADPELAPFQDPERAYLYIGSTGSFNFGHWLVDDLPRAKAWLELKAQSGISSTIILPSFDQKMNDVRFESLRSLIDSKIEVQFVDPRQPCRVSNLYYVTPVSLHPRIKNPTALDFVRGRATLKLEDGSSPHERLFVARRPPNSRTIVNFDEVFAFLAARGFRMIEPETLSFLDQIRLFRNAFVVVGQMGAAMTSSLFCRPGTNLVYLAPAGWTEPFYLDLAVLGGQQYNILPGPTEGHPEPYLANFHVPIAPLFHRLKYMGHVAAA